MVAKIQKIDETGEVTVFEDKEIGNVSLRLGEYIRVLKLTRKPSKEEFSVIAKVAGAGILLVGFIGFIIYILIIFKIKSICGNIIVFIKSKFLLI